MEHAGVTPPGALRAPDLAAVLERPGPFLTVYLTTEAEIANASQRTQARWKALRDDAEAAGVPAGPLDAVEALVDDAHLEGQCLAAVADGTGLVHRSHHPEVPDRDLFRWGPVPSIGTVLEWRQGAVPHVVVRTDRSGADIVIVPRSGDEEHVEAGGADDPLHKVSVGGWSSRRYQERVENTWAENADDVAKQVTAAVERVGARLVVVAGDVRAVTLLEESLPDEIRALVRQIDGGRGADGSEAAIAADVATLVATVAAEETVELRRKLREELGQADRAVEGVAAVVDRLRQAQVEVLLVHDDPADSRTLWFGPEGPHVGASPDELRALGVDQPREGRAVDVLIRSALLTGAGIRIVPAAGLAENAAAILRWSR